MPTWSASKAGYNNLWDKSKITRTSDTNAMVNRIMANKERYQLVETATGVPWMLVAALHARESNLSFAGILHSGERIIGTGRKSSQLVPKGVGPFNSWHESAIDAMKFKNLHKVKDWPVARMLYEAERYNGWGYVGKINSPYVWAGTSNQQPGKYIRDHVFSPTAVDKQLGVAAIIRGLADADQSVGEVVDGSDTSTETPGATVPPLSALTIPELVDLLKKKGAKSVLVEW